MNRHRSPGHLVDALVIDPRRPHRHRTRRGHHLPLGVVTVAHHQPVTGFVELVGVRRDIRGDLGMQRRCEHLPGTVTHDLIEQPTAKVIQRPGAYLRSRQRYALPRVAAA